MIGKLIQPSIVLYLASLIWSQANAAQDYYAAYGLFPQGPNRITAMGGASTALSDDATAIVGNPAGLTFMNYWGDLGGNFNSVWNREADLNNDGVKDGLPSGYLYYGGALQFTNWSFGIGLVSPYLSELSVDTKNGNFTENRKLSLSLSGVNIPFAFKISEVFSAGFTIQALNLEQRYRFSSTNTAATSLDVKGQNGGLFFSTGVSYRPSNSYGFGLLYTPQAQFPMDTQLNSKLAGIQWFKPAIIPAKISLGTFYRPSDTWLFALDLDLIQEIKETVVYIGSELIPEFSRVEIETTPKTILHGGAEWNYYSSRLIDLYARAGAYYEPPRIKNQRASRHHTTAGLEIRVWLIAISGSIDWAPDFTNAAGGLGLNLKYYL
jgi:long-subunit fatty acid transport protein